MRVHMLFRARRTRIRTLTCTHTRMAQASFAGDDTERVYGRVRRTVGVRLVDPD